MNNGVRCDTCGQELGKSANSYFSRNIHDRAVEAAIAKGFVRFDRKSLAEAAKVTPADVSNILTGNGYVHPAARERIEGLLGVPCPATPAYNRGRPAKKAREGSNG